MYYYDRNGNIKEEGQGGCGRGGSKEEEQTLEHIHEHRKNK